jgi:hypothetical protein
VRSIHALDLPALAFAARKVAEGKIVEAFNSLWGNCRLVEKGSCECGQLSLRDQSTDL